MSTTLTKSRTQTPPPITRNPLAVLRHEIDDLIARFWDGEPEKGWQTSSFVPSLDLVERDNAFEIHLDIPGMEAKDIDVQVHGSSLTVSGERKEEKEETGKTYHRAERRNGSFSRIVSLPCKINEDEVAAEYANGVLTLKLPKCEDAKSKKITVKS